MGIFNDYLNNARNLDPKEKERKLEYYEDTHKNGVYTGKNNAARSLPDNSQFVTPRNYQNLVVYEPKTVADIQKLIDYLKRKEPAIINLDHAEPEVAQRILDFAAGAIYALYGSIHKVADGVNIFLLTPEGVEITVPYEGQ